MRQNNALKPSWWETCPCISRVFSVGSEIDVYDI